ncbi:hypothetical protein C0389_05640 [bacterium]|nr:hypothetical protein [bacterium]
MPTNHINDVPKTEFILLQLIKKSINLKFGVTKTTKFIQPPNCVYDKAVRRKDKLWTSGRETRHHSNPASRDKFRMVFRKSWGKKTVLYRECAKKAQKEDNYFSNCDWSRRQCLSGITSND